MVGTPATPASKTRRLVSTTREEKILVTVRVRPLSRREQSMYDLIAWDCPDQQTIILRNPNTERPSAPYTFDNVFDPTSITQKVYEEGAKSVALSALTGINATIFAYGQTSSGKTFTMRGITDLAINDIFHHITQSRDREFSLKISALEIYNETVVDLLNRASGPLRLLDDPEKGVIVEKLVEEVVKDSQHLRQIIGICEAQRQVGETGLNDQSSRSHQIIRLTIESTLREKSARVESFLATLNLVDLAGSERASQTNADGTRLKEGSHINRSLLTLTTVIRKLSGGRRSGHVPYRDSKLTRILQHSLGGNARTAIICTISPALSHVEQTRNTLGFATSAKEVTNNAQVNMVISNKNLVKHLQQEVARLASELQTPETSSISQLKSSLLQKSLRIDELENEIKELKRERDLAQSQLELERKSRKELKGNNQSGPSSQVVRQLPFSIESGALSRDGRKCSAISRQGAARKSLTSNDPIMLVQEIRKLEQQQRQLGEEANKALEMLHKEVASQRMGSQATAETVAKMLSEIKSMHVAGIVPEETVFGQNGSLKEELSRLDLQETTIATLEKKLDNVQKSIEMLVCSFSSADEIKKGLPFTVNNSSNVHLMRSTYSPVSTSHGANGSENKDPTTPIGSVACTPLKVGHTGNISSKEETPSSRSSKSVTVKKMQKLFKNAAEENIRSIRAYVSELKERVAKLQYQKQLLVCQVLELEGNEDEALETKYLDESPISWHLLFKEQRKQIIMLWHLCHVSIIHRTQFYLLFKGEASDEIYVEVELNRLTWLEQHFAELGNASPALLGDEPAGLVSQSIKALRQEREYLAKRVSSKLGADEREMLYEKWDIPPGGKQRRLQLVNKLWTDPLNMEHVHESADIVAKLVGFCESQGDVRKEMFALNLVNPCDKKSWMGWNFISNLLNL
ncbi:Kinesin-like protein NACK2 [Linum perenne]